MTIQHLHPRTDRVLTLDEFHDLRRTVAIRSATRRGVEADPGYSTPVPREISIQLTYKCNLRCTHCYQWSEDGFFRDFSHDKARSEVDPDVFAKLLEYTESTRAKVFLWGGEPLMHSRFGEIAGHLARHKRTVNMCTNGLLIERNLEHILPLGRSTNLVISLDGLEDAHDKLRGKRSFQRTVRNIDTLLELQRTGEYLGEVSVGCMISDGIADQMYDFMEWAEEKGVNTVYFQFPWFIGPESVQKMDELYAEEFAWLNPPAPGTKASWHSYSYHLSEESIAVVEESMARLASRTWRSRIRFQPQLTVAEAASYLRGHATPAQGKQRCLAVSNRLEIHADGNVSSCKFFPEFVIGNLNDQSPADIWEGAPFRRVRESLHRSNLMPVCSKCGLLYMNGV